MAQSATSSVSWTYPRDLVLTINVIDTIVVQWTSNFDQAYLWLFCDFGTGNNPLVHLASTPVEPSGNNSFTPSNNNINPPNSNARYRCHFDLNYLDQLEKGKNGPAFSLTSLANQNIPTTYALQYTSFARSSSQSVGSGTSTLASSSAADQPTASNAQTLSSNNSSTGLSTGAIAGIAVGAITGVLALLALGFIVWRNKRKVEILQSRTSAGYGVGNGNPQGVQPSSAVQDDLPILKQTYAMELQAQPYQAPPQELPGSNVVPGKR